ncbi:MAG: hypothetical protein Q9160_004464 [Pyrenula sp. 1 TL-2023]
MSRYCVRPNSGTIPPNGNVEVQVLLQAMKEDPPLDTKCRDKFLVQSVPTGNAEESSGGFPAMWSSIEKTNKSAIQERKIRVNFLPANTSATPNGVATQDHQQHQPDDGPPAYSSPPPQFGSPISSSTTSNTVPIDSKPVGAKSLSEAKASASNPATNTTNSISNAASAVTSALPTSTEELKKQLAEARAQIAKLKDSATDSGLRQRKMQEAGEKLQTAMPAGGETGVPLQMVAGLCLLSFLLAYFFF